MKIVDMPQKNTMREALEPLRRNMSEYIEYMVLMAELQKAKYDACLKQGFKPEQALELSKQVF